MTSEHEPVTPATAHMYLGWPAESWTYERVDAFLSARLRESATLDYKKDFSERMTETLVAMANTDGGNIFLGVSDRASRPDKWPTLPPGKDHEHTAYQFSGLTIPPIPMRARAVIHPTTGRQIVVIRVEAGADTPYYVQEHGVVIRVGDRSVPADRPTFERLFARRERYSQARAQIAARFRQHLGSSHQGSTEVLLSGLVAPPLENFRTRFDELGMERLRALRASHLPGLPRTETRFADGVRFLTPDADQGLMLTRSGELRYWRLLRDNVPGDGGRPRLSIERLGRGILDFLRVAAGVFPDVLMYDGALYLGMAAERIHARDLIFPTLASAPHIRTPHRVSEAEASARWVEDEVDFNSRTDPRATTVKLLHALCFALAYDGLHPYLDALVDGFQP